MTIVNCDGEVFFASRTVEQYLGFHQSDILHQSALELIHSEDRDDFQNQLNWRSQLPQSKQDMTLQQVMMPENHHLLQRSFTVRFRCLLDNTSGFITLEISGKIRMLHGQNLKCDNEEPPLALFATCCPFGPLPLLDTSPRDYTFKTKHKMDLAPISMDHRGKMLFGYSDKELSAKGGYDLIHPDDLNYFAAAHQELIKTGSSGLICYRFITKDFQWIWLQTSAKVIYKNSKPEFVLCTHRHLTEDEGMDLIGKRGNEFKLPYPLLDMDTSGFGMDSDNEEYSKKAPKPAKKPKNQLRDYLQTGRKRKSPYREVNGSIAAYGSTYPGYPGSEVKAEVMYPYATPNNNIGIDSADFYRGYTTFPPTLYPTAATDPYRLEGEKQHYANSYYSSYPSSLQYPTNGYSDVNVMAAKYSYDMSKYGYDVTGYGLDLAKRGSAYDDDISKYDSEYRKYSQDYATSEKLTHRVNGSYDSLKSTAYDSLKANSYDTLKGSSYDTLKGSNYDSLKNSTYDTLKGGSIYPSSSAYLNSSDRLQGVQIPTASIYRTEASIVEKFHSDIDSKIMPIASEAGGVEEITKTSVPHGQTSVIRSASEYYKNSVTNNNNTILPSYAQTAIVETPSTQCNGSTWTSCSKMSAYNSMSSSPHQNTNTPSPVHITGSEAHKMNSPNKENNGVIALNSAVTNNSSSPSSATTATSVIQQTSRLHQKQSLGGIAVPVVKTPMSLHGNLHLTAQHTPESISWQAAADTYKNSIMKAGERGHGIDSNPLLSFSEMTHTLLTG
ncbi:unnamed protein product [Owenia fusiformis]|nr:unnamed protein product [Owenia fusiformis]